MNRLASWLLLVLALGLCAWSIATAEEGENGGQDETSPTPDPLAMTTPVPLDNGSSETPPEAGLEMPTPVPLDGAQPPSPELAPTPEMSVSETPPTPAASPVSVQAAFQGQVALKTAADMVWDAANEYVWSNDLYAFMSGSATWGDTFGAVASGLFEYRYDIAEEAHGEALPELRDLYVRARWKWLDLYAGYQVVSWGVVDGINPMDILNPYDYRRVVDIELDYARLPTLMVRPIVYLGPVSIEVAYLPLFTPPRYEVVGGDWSLTGMHFPLNDMLAELRTDEHWVRFERALNVWAPSWNDNVQQLLDDPDFYTDAADLPPQDLTAPEAAARVSLKLPDVDLHAAYYALWEDLPTLHINPVFGDLYKYSEATEQGFAQLPPVEDWPLDDLSPFTLTHHRVQSVGLGAAGVLKDVGLRAEGRADFDRYTYRRDLSAVRRNMMNWVLNADYTFAGDLLVSGLLIQGYLFDREDDFISRAWTNELGVVVRRPFLNDRLLAEIFGLIDFTYMRDSDWQNLNLGASGWIANPMLTYSVTDPLRVSLGLTMFGGRDTTELGLLERNNRVFALVRYGF